MRIIIIIYENYIYILPEENYIFLVNFKKNVWLDPRRYIKLMFTNKIKVYRGYMENLNQTFFRITRERIKVDDFERDTLYRHTHT